MLKPHTFYILEYKPLEQDTLVYSLCWTNSKTIRVFDYGEINHTSFVYSEKLFELWKKQFNVRICYAQARK